MSVFMSFLASQVYVVKSTITSGHPPESCSPSLTAGSGSNGLPDKPLSLQTKEHSKFIQTANANSEVSRIFFSQNPFRMSREELEAEDVRSAMNDTGLLSMTVSRASGDSWTVSAEIALDASPFEAVDHLQETESSQSGLVPCDSSSGPKFEMEEIQEEEGNVYLVWTNLQDRDAAIVQWEYFNGVLWKPWTGTCRTKPFRLVYRSNLRCLLPSSLIGPRHCSDDVYFIRATILSVDGEVLGSCDMTHSSFMAQTERPPKKRKVIKPAKGSKSPPPFQEGRIDFGFGDLFAEAALRSKPGTDSSPLPLDARDTNTSSTLVPASPLFFGSLATSELPRDTLESTGMINVYNKFADKVLKDVTCSATWPEDGTSNEDGEDGMKAHQKIAQCSVLISPNRGIVGDSQQASLDKRSKKKRFDFEGRKVRFAYLLGAYRQLLSDRVKTSSFLPLKDAHRSQLVSMQCI